MQSQRALDDERPGARTGFSGAGPRHNAPIPTSGMHASQTRAGTSPRLGAGHAIEGGTALKPRTTGRLSAILGSTLVWGLATALPGWGAGTSASSLKAAQMVDLAPNHWAYSAIQSLVEKYRLMTGYPDMTFRGEKSVSRYELAAVLGNLMARMEGLQDRGAQVPVADTRTLERLRDEFKVELFDLHARVTALEAGSGSIEIMLRELKNLAVANNKVHGNIGFTIKDDPEDRLKPFVVSSFEVRFGADLDENTSYSASISGGQPAAASGGQPLFTRGGDLKDKGLPDGVMTLGTNAQITTKLQGLGSATLKVGHFAPGAVMGLGGFAHHYWDGIIGSGLSGPSGNTVRTGSDDIGLGFKTKLGAVGLGAGLNTQFVYGGGSLALGDLGDLRVIADYDHNSIGNVSLEGDATWHVAGSANLGSDKAIGVSLQGGVTGNGSKLTPKAGANVIVTPMGTEICAGATLKTDPDQTTWELVPTGYVYVPQGLMQVPVLEALSLLIGAKEPETLVGKNNASGPGSLLGSKAGFTTQVGVANPWVPNLTLEINYQANVLGPGVQYDGIGYAISTSTDF